MGYFKDQVGQVGRGGCLRIGGAGIYIFKFNSKWPNKCALLPTHHEGESIAGRICFSCSGQKPKEQGLPLETKSRWLVLAWLLWWLIVRQKLAPTLVALPSSTRGSALHARPRDTKRPYILRNHNKMNANTKNI